MALPSSSCFFCCKNLGNEKDPFKKSDDREETFPSFDNTEKTTVISKQHLYQISHYLHLPKHQIDQYHLPTLTICQRCEEISSKLSTLCSDLEVTKMKINYYLNLLTDQILAESTSDNSQDYNQSNISAFQQIFQDKCLTTLSRTNVNPQLILTKCEIQPGTIDEQPVLDDTEDDYQEYQVYYQENNEDCSENDQSNENVKVNNPTRKLYDRSARKCEHCDKIISYTNMSSHKRFKHGIIPTGYRPSNPSKYSKYKERVGCEYCGRMLSYRNLSTHKKYYCAVKLNKSSGNGRKVKCRLNEVDKFTDKPDNVKQLLQTCGHCGQVVLKERFGDHEQLWCPITKVQVTNNCTYNYENTDRNLEENNFNVKMEQDGELPVEVQLQL